MFNFNFQTSEIWICFERRNLSVSKWNKIHSSESGFVFAFQENFTFSREAIFTVILPSWNVTFLIEKLHSGTFMSYMLTKQVVEASVWYTVENIFASEVYMLLFNIIDSNFFQRHQM